MSSCDADRGDADGAALPLANPLLSCARRRWMPAFAGMTRAACEIEMPVSAQVLDLSTFEQNTL
ncbi:hypothetical protein EBQ25_09360 [Allofranklinella schreckenbergeri]|uniref:Uncharacterized protein n=1 Tax=Allofranklinella schreckenbergeri TaxID=1076744 RepID=A0A3M6Q6B4_9BURK|nr:hypothetical protein EBQ25_09360 [Allofranklinella schreckenbergeri]